MYLLKIEVGFARFAFDLNTIWAANFIKWSLNLRWMTGPYIRNMNIVLLPNELSILILFEWRYLRISDNN